ncbi:carboxymuconolactone decarboxylase [Alteromonas alba]|uniref:Carboxymuconolactone decarboxylase n=2 Tax=Alteromonas alba TaxID=2079529 RepID=A0A2S9V5F2_9ALTE|nr:carboxymuconolactone decarboxylase [Alteromonas alba]
MPNKSRRSFLKTSTILIAVCYGHLALGGCSILPKPTFRENQEMNNDVNDRYARGWQKLKEIDGEAGENVIDALRDIAPDLGRYIIEFPFGDVYSRDGLDLKSREIATVAALSAMGNAAPQLKVHINAALNVGCLPHEIVEVIIQISVYAGFPAALNAASVAKSVFAERGVI